MYFAYLPSCLSGLLARPSFFPCSFPFPLALSLSLSTFRPSIESSNGQGMTRNPVSRVAWQRADKNFLARLDMIGSEKL